MHPFTITNAITAALTQIERARGFLEAARLSEEWLRGMRARALVLEAHYTTHIEGTHLTQLELRHARSANITTGTGRRTTGRYRKRGSKTWI